MRLTSIALLLVVCGSTVVVAGGPSKIVHGSAILWNPTSAIAYQTDLGAIGVITEAQVPGLVSNAFSRWAKVPTAALSFSAATLNEDVHTTVRFLQIERDSSMSSVVVSDNAGAIVEGVYGLGSSRQVLGFASPLLNTSGSEITRFAAAMNGRLATSVDLVLSTLVHELGHALGLDHSQINDALATDGDPLNDQYLPTMIPTSTDNDASLIDLNPDDEAWISRLYPGSTFASTYGTISGRVIRGGAPVLGANVVAIAVINGADDMRQRYSCVSDYLLKGDGRFDLSVPPGTYKLEVEPINPAFSGGSSVGPHAALPSSPSFQNPVRKKSFTGFKVMVGTVLSVGDLKVQ